MKLFSVLLAIAALVDVASAGKKCGKPKEGDDLSTTAAPNEGNTTTAAPARRLRRLEDDDKEKSPKKCATGGLEFEVKGKSGKMLFYRNGKRKDGIEVEMDSLIELDAAENPVGKGGKHAAKHSFNNFKNLDVIISEMEESTYQGIAAYQTTFNAPINGGNFIADIYLMLANGTIANGDEIIDVAPGQFKMTFTTENWQFCNGTQADTESVNHCVTKKGEDEVGTMLDLTVKIKSKQAKAKKGGKAGKRGPKDEKGKHRPAELDLGDGATLSLSSMVEVDGKWMDMPGADAVDDSYPKVEQKGTSMYYTFRLPAGEKVFYDPGVDMGVTAEDFETAFAQEEAAISASTEPTTAPEVAAAAENAAITALALLIMAPALHI
jgi:hypothetical protein